MRANQPMSTAPRDGREITAVDVHGYEWQTRYKHGSWRNTSAKFEWFEPILRVDLAGWVPPEIADRGAS